MKKDEDVFYYAALLTGGTLAVLMVVYTAFLHEYIKLPHCIFRYAFGIYCPGCGMSRAGFALLRGHPVRSFLCNPCFLYFLAVYLFYVGGQTAARLFHLRCRRVFRWRNGYLYAGLALLALNTILRNVLWLGFQIPIPSSL